MNPTIHPFPLELGNAPGPSHARPVLPSAALRFVPVCFCLLGLALPLVPGCATPEPREQSSLADEGQTLFGTAPDPGKTPGNTTASQGAWAIVIVAFGGPDQQAAAAAGLARARTQGGLRDAYTRREGSKTVIAYGRYPGPDSPEAKADLNRIRNLGVEGGRPFAGAVLAPPDGAGTGRVPDLDLRRVKSDFGPDAIYTLQIAAYGRDDRKPPQNEKERAEFVRMAEDAAAQLRREGEQAFYYHGPNMSVVTIGVFGPEDFDPQRPEFRSERLRAAEAAHPENLLNGKGIRVRAPGLPASSPKAWRTAKSFLTAVPTDR